MIVSWMTTNQCNLKCVHCYQDAEEATERELTTDEAKKMIDEIARAGFKIMIFSGGEPLLRPDIYELVAHAASRGLRPVFERLRTQAYSGACGTCDYKDGCGGCRARAAYYHDGDILAQDDYCAHGQQLDVHSAIAE